MSKNYESLSEVHSSIHIAGKTGWRKLLAYIGPAYLVSVGYMDPGNWATDIAGGSQFGYKLIWVLLMSNLIALLLQSLSARLGIVKQLDLAQASRKAYPSAINFFLFIFAQIAIIACDLAEIIGMAIGLQLLFKLPLLWGVSITILDTLLLLVLLNKGMRMMESFIVSMVFIVGISFLAEMFIVEPEITEIAKGLKPSALSGDALYIAIGIIGATVMPHNLYLHSSLVQTRRIDRSHKGIKEALKFNIADTAIALNLAFFVNAAILILAAAAFYRNGLYEVADIRDAHKLLENIFGPVAPALFAIALIASGQSSTVTGTLAGQIIMEGHLNLRIAPWVRRLLTRLLAIIPAFLTIVYYGDDALGGLLVLSQVVLSLQLGFAIIPLIHFTSDKTLMDGFAIKTGTKIIAWISALVIVGLNIRLVSEEILGWINRSNNNWWVYALIIPVTGAVLLLLLYVLFAPWIDKRKHRATKTPHGKALQIESIENILYQHIGIPVDFSQNDRNIIRHALIQGGKKAEYFLIHVVETAAASYHGNKVFDHETQSDRENLEKYQENLQALGYNVQVLIGYGKVSKAIPEFAKDKKLDLLVMGAHGHTGISDLIFGTTLDIVRHRVNIPILVVK
ncbi:iron/manganese transporter [Pedobacter sp. BS3]|nr:Nramp family divalent metal transporter [Pedobacter sp. BS3]TZF84129.1 iron/manganese transporter [Pedobacter sp. BS3]